MHGLMGTLKPHSNGPLYSNAVIGTLAVNGCRHVATGGVGGGAAAFFLKKIQKYEGRSVNKLQKSSFC